MKKPTVYAIEVHVHEVRNGIPGRRFVYVGDTLVVVGPHDDLGRHDATRRFSVTCLVVSHRVLRVKLVLNNAVALLFDCVLLATVRVEWFVIDGVVGAVHAGGVEDNSEVDHLDGRTGIARGLHPQLMVFLQPETRLRALLEVQCCEVVWKRQH